MTKSMDERVAKNNAKQAKKAARLLNGKNKGASATKEGLKGLMKNAHHRIIALSHQKKKLPKLTDDTIGEYREKILAGGRKFKYPVQASKHKILWISLATVLLALLVFAGWVYVALYHAQSTDDFYYDVARISPLPVANVDGQNANYGDYLRRLRADIFYYKTQENTDLTAKTNRKELNYNQRKELNAAEMLAYAQKIANARHITISNDEVQQEIDQQLSADKIDSGTLTRTLSSYYGWSMDEYRDAIRSQLLIQRVSFTVDTEAKSEADYIYKQLTGGADFATLAKKYSDDQTSRDNGGEINGRTDSKLTQFMVAKSLKVGQTSKPAEYIGFDGTLGYVIVKLVSRDNDNLKIDVIQINLKQLMHDFDQLRHDYKISEYISVPDSSSFAK